MGGTPMLLFQYTESLEIKILRVVRRDQLQIQLMDRCFSSLFGADNNLSLSIFEVSRDFVGNRFFVPIL